MLGTILKIRALQLWRIIKSLGIFRSFFILAILVFLVAALLTVLKDNPESYITSIVVGFGILVLHISRKDKHFIKVSFYHSYILYLIEYFILLVPIIGACLYYQSWYNAAILFLTGLLIPRIYLNLGLNNFGSAFRFLVNPFSSNIGFKLNIPVPVKDPRLFEWISGLRRYIILILPIYLLILGFSFKYLVGPIGMIILSLFISGFYYYGEPRELIEIFETTAEKFLRNKIFLCLKYLLLFLSPIAVLAFVFQYQTWYLTLAAMFLASMVLVITIIFKYGLFAENRDLGRNGVIILFNISCVLLPFFWPLPLIMGIRYYKKAQQHLKNYLYD